MTEFRDLSEISRGEGGWEFPPSPRLISDKSLIVHFRNEKATGAEMRLAIVSGIVTGEASVSYWSISPLALVTVPEVFAKVNSTLFPTRL